MVTATVVVVTQLTLAFHPGDLFLAVKRKTNVHVRYCIVIDGFTCVYVAHHLLCAGQECFVGKSLVETVRSHNGGRARTSATASNDNTYQIRTRCIGHVVNPGENTPPSIALNGRAPRQE